MKRLALAVLALAIIVIMPASAQSGVPVKNALVVVSAQDDIVLESVLAAGGSPSGVLDALETAEGLLSTSAAPRVPTDAAGRFELDAPLSPGTYNVRVFAPGFVSSSDSVSLDGGAANNLTIFMQPSAMVSGRVTDEQGRPVSGIVVAASSPHSTNYDITMDDGVFVLDTGLQTGPHDIYAFKPGVDVAALQGILNNPELGLLENKVPALFKTDDGGYVSQVSKVQLEQGKLTSLNVELKGSHIVSGSVADSAGNVVPGVAVFAFDDSGAMANTAAVTDSAGQYTLDNDLTPGTYTIVVPSLFSKGYAPAGTTITLPAENSVNFVLNESGTIGGRVVDARGSPVAGATIIAVSNDLNLGDTQLARFLAAGTATAKTDQDGRFLLQGSIGSGVYTVTASFGSVPISSSMEVQAGGTANIALDFEETIMISGKVTDDTGSPLENALVIPTFARAIAGAELFSARTGPDGAYTLTVPLKDNSTISLFDEITVSADGYKSATAQSGATVKLEKVPAAKITGLVIAQKPLTPPVETVLTRNGTVIFEHEGSLYGVGLQTNSRVLDAAFDPASRSISVNLEGVQDAAGRSEFSVPKEFMEGPFAVSLDGEVATRVTTTENQTHATIAVEHQHDLREITIQGTIAVPEFPLPAVLAAAAMTAVLVWMRSRR